MSNSTFKVIIAGGRDFTDYAFAAPKISRILENYPYRDIEIVSGGARGADAIGEHWAIACGVKLTKFNADWGTHGKKAGILRNIEMGQYADALIAFWDGGSRGTQHMIDHMMYLGKPVRVIKY